MIYIDEDSTRLNIPRTWSEEMGTITIATPLEDIQVAVEDAPFGLSAYATLLGVSEDAVQRLFMGYYIKAKVTKQGTNYVSDVELENGIYQMRPSVSANIEANSIVQFVKYTNTDNEILYTVLFVR